MPKLSYINLERHGVNGGPIPQITDGLTTQQRRIKKKRSLRITQSDKTIVCSVCKRLVGVKVNGLPRTHEYGMLGGSTAKAVAKCIGSLSLEDQANLALIRSQ